MAETKWVFGYRCEVGRSSIDGNCWVGAVYVPRWHPVRSKGLGDHVVFLIQDDWIVFIDGTDGFYETSNRCCMQREWDVLSPYEREYLVRS